MSDQPLSPRAELEMRLTSLLLGELSAEEAAVVRQAMEADPELQRLHDQLQQTIGLVREVAASPGGESSVPVEEIKLSAERREQLLNSFKAPRPAPRVRRVNRVMRRELTLIAAMLVGVVVVATLLFSSFTPRESSLAFGLPIGGRKYYAHSAESEFAADDAIALASPVDGSRSGRALLKVTETIRSRVADEGRAGAVVSLADAGGALGGAGVGFGSTPANPDPARGTVVQFSADGKAVRSSGGVGFGGASSTPVAAQPESAKPIAELPAVYAGTTFRRSAVVLPSVSEKPVAERGDRGQVQLWDVNSSAGTEGGSRVLDRAGERAPMLGYAMNGPVNNSREAKPADGVGLNFYADVSRDKAVAGEPVVTAGGVPLPGAAPKVPTAAPTSPAPTPLPMATTTVDAFVTITKGNEPNLDGELSKAKAAAKPASGPEKHLADALGDLQEARGKDRLAMDDSAWKREMAPAPVVVDPSTGLPVAEATQKAAESTSRSKSKVNALLDSTRIDSFKSDFLPLQQVAEALGQEAKKQNPQGNGLNFIFNNPNATPQPPPNVEPATGLPIVGAEAPEVGMTAIKLDGSGNMTLRQALDEIVKKSGDQLAYSVEDYGVVFSKPETSQAPPQSSDLHTRWYAIDAEKFVKQAQNTTAFDFGNQSLGGQGGGGGGGGAQATGVGQSPTIGRLFGDVSGPSLRPDSPASDVDGKRMAGAEYVGVALAGQTAVRTVVAKADSKPAAPTAPGDFDSSLVIGDPTGPRQLVDNPAPRAIPPPALVIPNLTPAPAQPSTEWSESRAESFSLAKTPASGPVTGAPVDGRNRGFVDQNRNEYFDEFGTAKDQKAQNQAGTGTLVQDAKLLFEAGRLDDAEAKLKAAIKAEPSSAAAHHYLGLVTNQRNSIAGSDGEVVRRKKIVEVEAAWNAVVKRDLITQNQYFRTNVVHTTKAKQKVDALSTQAPEGESASRFGSTAEGLQVEAQQQAQAAPSESRNLWETVRGAFGRNRESAAKGVAPEVPKTAAPQAVELKAGLGVESEAARFDPNFRQTEGEKLGSKVYSEQLARLERLSDRRGDAKSVEELKKRAESDEPPPPLRRPAPDAPVPQPEVATADNAFSTFSLNVSDVSFKLAAASLEKGQMPEASTVRTEEFINALDYRDPEPMPGQRLAFHWERARYPFAHNRDLVRFSVKTAASGRQAGRPLNVVLLLDNSGSMERADRIRIRQECLRVLASQLQPQDRISVVAFARTPRLWVDGLSGQEAGSLVKRVGDLTPEGGTNLEEAMKLAYQTARRHFQANGINRVVLLTDGAANLGDVDPASLKRSVELNRQQGVALDCFGLGWDGYNDDLLEALSRNGDGRYGFINTPEAAAGEFAGQLAGALKVAASDVKVQVQFNPRRVTAYRQMGYAKHQLKKEQFRDNTVDAAEIGAAEAGNALYVVEVNPNGEGPLGVARVRFKVPGTQDYREQEWTLTYDGTAKSFDQAAASLRLAGVAAAFGEWLVASPYAAEVTPGRLQGYLSGVAGKYTSDPRPKQLESMLRQAGSLR